MPDPQGNLTVLDPITQRDFSSGRIAKSAVSTALMPNFSSHTLQSAINSVSNSINVDFSEIIGSGIVRQGKYVLGTIITNVMIGQNERVSGSGNEVAYDANVLAQTFTVGIGQVTTQGIIIQIYFTGENETLAQPPNFTVSLNTTSAGKPTTTVINGNSWTLNAGTITTSSAGQLYFFPCSPNTVLTVGGVYAIVLSFPNGDSSDAIEWIRNSSNVYAGGTAYTSSDGGSTWSSTTGTFFFSQMIYNFNTPYNLAPLGNYSFLNAGLPKNVIAFNGEFSGIDEGIIYYYNATTGTWQVSNLFLLNNLAKIRFANMNGSVFMANGTDLMKSSSDFGHTWSVENCISPYPVDTAQAWNSSISYSIYNATTLTGGIVLYGGLYYISLQNTNENNEPDTSHPWWQQITYDVSLQTPATGDVLVYPSLLLVSDGRLLASGWSAFPSRVFFSELIQPIQTPFLSWNTDLTTGAFLDIDPDNNGIVTAFAVTSTLTLIFKNNGMYRLNVASKSVDPQNIYNVGAVSQEAVTTCLGNVYFYSGNGIYYTDGTFPQLISRIGVQDFVNAISNPQQVYAWQDGFNVYFSIGTVTITFNPNDTRTYTNVVLKFSPRDQNWSIFTYNEYIAQTSLFGLPGPQVELLATEYSGQLVIVNSSQTFTSDDGNAIPYSLETQELEFGNRAHTKQISDRIIVFTRNGGNGMFLVRQNDGNFKTALMDMNNRVNIGNQPNFEAEFFTFRWQGEALGSRPVWEGYHLPRVSDLGIIQQ